MALRSFLLWLLLITAAHAQELRFPSSDLEWNGRNWTYYSSTPKVSSPVVLVLHGTGGSGGSYLARTGWGMLAQKHGFTAVAPSAQPVDPEEPADFNRNPRRWQKEDGPLFDALLSKLGNPRKVYLVGHSNGAMMCFWLAQRNAARWSGLAAVGMHPPVDAEPLNKNLPTLVLVGEDDPIVPWRGGKGQTRWGSREFASLDGTLERWAGALGLHTAPAWTDEGEEWRKHYAPYFQAVRIKGQGHGWPGWSGQLPREFGPNLEGYPAAERIWEFFQKWGS